MVARAPDTDVRQEVVAAATRLFAAHGFDGTALQDIADAVGVTKPAVLHHFRSKEHLRAAVLDAIVAHWNGALPRLLLASHSAQERFEAVLGELLSFFGEHPERARVVLREALDRPAEITRILRGAIRPWLDALAEGIRAGQRVRRYRADVDPDAFVMHLLQIVIAAGASASVGESAIEPDGAARYRRELARIARASLLSEIPPEPTSRDSGPSSDETTPHAAGDERAARTGAKAKWPASSPTTKTSSSTSTKRSTGRRSRR
jgi:AcrR family transcriptional regulator